MKDKKNEIIPFVFAGKIDYKSPNPEDYKISNENIVKEIKRAWDEGCIINKTTGCLFISEKYLHSILRMQKDNVERMIKDDIKDNDKIKFKGIVYINSDEVVRLLNKRIFSPIDSKTRKNLKFSRATCQAIGDSEDVQIRQLEYAESIKENKPKLKAKRKKTFKIENDELTGEPLDKKESDFSHIRSCSEYPELILYIQNGLVVNKSTHKKITKENIVDESGLYKLCKEEGWSISWYNEFTKFLQTVYKQDSEFEEL